MTNHYQRGVTFERQVRQALEADGYECVRSAGSKSKIDLVAIKPGELLFLQCKLNGLCPPAERAKLLDLSRSAGALPIVAYKGVEGRLRPVRYRWLTGPGPKDYRDFTTDQLSETGEER
jgi:Holliday junction resolvase